jgi:AcrR family transcriptional regulator
MPESGRVAQRRRTRKAIVDATMGLLAAGGTPSVNDVAAAADVSRRTVYLHFPSLDQLLLDAVVGSMNTGIDEALAATDSDDPRVRLRALVEALAASMAATLLLGRQLIRLTVDRAADHADGPVRGYRRVGWIEDAVGPARERLGPAGFERLVSALSVVVGWEAFIVLTDVRGLDNAAAGSVCLEAALALLAAAETAAGRPGAGQPARSRTEIEPSPELTT